MKIRIGNDIRLDIQLSLDDEQTPMNVQFVKAIFVNTTLKDKIESEYKNKNRFIGRFPIEPYLNEFEPSAYRINSTGNPRYTTVVMNQYNGFGVYPNWKKCFPFRLENITEYSAEVFSTSDPNQITVYFPASAQLYEGIYELILVVKVYDAGYKNNTRTFTVNNKNIFELVSNSVDTNSTNTVGVSVQLDAGFSRQDVYVTSGVYSDNNILLSRNDGSAVNIDVGDITGWYEA